MSLSCAANVTACSHRYKSPAALFPEEEQKTRETDQEIPSTETSEQESGYSGLPNQKGSADLFKERPKSRRKPRPIRRQRRRFSRRGSDSPDDSESDTPVNRSIATNCNTCDNHSDEMPQQVDTREWLLGETRALGVEISQLKGYCDIHYVAFSKIMRRYEKSTRHLPTDQRAVDFQRELKQQPFYKCSKLDNFVQEIRALDKQLVRSLDQSGNSDTTCDYIMYSPCPSPCFSPSPALESPSASPCMSPLHFASPLRKSLSFPISITAAHVTTNSNNHMQDRGLSSPFSPKSNGKAWATSRLLATPPSHGSALSPKSPSWSPLSPTFHPASRSLNVSCRQGDSPQSRITANSRTTILSLVSRNSAPDLTALPAEPDTRLSIPSYSPNSSPEQHRMQLAQSQPSTPCRSPPTMTFSLLSVLPAPIISTDLVALRSTQDEIKSTTNGSFDLSPLSLEPIETVPSVTEVVPELQLETGVISAGTTKQDHQPGEDQDDSNPVNPPKSHQYPDGPLFLQCHSFPGMSTSSTPPVGGKLEHAECYDLSTSVCFGLKHRFSSFTPAKRYKSMLELRSLLLQRHDLQVLLAWTRKIVCVRAYE